MQLLDLNVEKREKLGSANSRRYCRAGKIPMILYGRGQPSVPLMCEADDFGAVTKAHTALVKLTVGDIRQTALIRDVEWDTFGDYVLHIDLVRVEAEDDVTLKIPMNYHGVAAGIAHGGALHIVLPEMELRCRVDSIPEELTVEVSHLEIGDSIHVGDLEYPAQVRPVRGDSDLLVHCKVPKVAVEKDDEEGEDEQAVDSDGEASADEASTEK